MPAPLALRLRIALTACLCLAGIPGWAQMGLGTVGSSTVVDQHADAAAEANAVAAARHDAAVRLLKLQHRAYDLIGEPRAKRLAKEVGALLLQLVDGRKPTAEIASDTAELEEQFDQLRDEQFATMSARGAGKADSSAPTHSGAATLLSIISLLLSGFLFVKRRALVEETLKKAGLL